MIQKRAEHILIGAESSYEPAKGGLGYEIFHAFNINKKKIAEHIIKTGECSTYGDLLERSIKISSFLKKKKLQNDDLVCVCSENNINCFIPFVAAKFVGVNYASLGTAATEDDMVYIWNYLKPKVLFITHDIEEKTEKSLLKANYNCEIIALDESRKYITLKQILAETEEEKNFQPIFIDNVKETAVIFLTSGTTGKPKGICISHYSLLAQVVNLFDHIHRDGAIRLSNFVHKYNNNEVTKVLFYSPIYWISGMFFHLAMTFVGGEKISGIRFNPKEALEALQKHKPKVAFLPPGQTNELCLYASSEKHDVTIDIFLQGGGLVTDRHLEKLEECFGNVRVVQVYGMTETGGAVSTFNVDDPREMELQKHHRESCGRIMNGVQIKIVDLDTEKICGPHEQGEIRTNNKYIMNGYYKMDSTSAFDSDGWFKTGDLGYFDENGCLYVIDRLKDILLYTVYNIRPSIIEKILYDHPAVFECIVLGIPHPTDNEHPMGVVVLVDSYKGKVTPEELTSYVNDRVPSDRYKIRAGIKFVEQLPKTSNGKLRKVELKQSILQGKI